MRVDEDFAADSVAAHTFASMMLPQREDDHYGSEFIGNFFADSFPPLRKGCSTGKRLARDMTLVAFPNGWIGWALRNDLLHHARNSAAEGHFEDPLTV